MFREIFSNVVETVYKRTKKQIHRETRQRQSLDNLITFIGTWASNYQLTGRQLQASYETNPYVNSAIGWLSRNISQLPYKILDADNNEYQDDPKFAVFEKPNPDMFRTDFLEMMILDYCAMGNSIIEPKGFYSKINNTFENWNVSEMLVLDPKPFTAETDELGNLDYLEEFNYQSHYKPDDVIWMREVSPYHRHIGVGRMKAAQSAIVGMGFIQLFVDKFFDQGGNLGLYFNTKEKLEDDIYDKTLEAIKASYSGVKNWFDPTLLQADVTARTIDVKTPMESGIKDGYMEYQKQIFAASGVMKDVIDGGNSNFNNFQTALTASWTQGAMPIIKKIDQAFSSLLPDGLYHKTDTSGVEVLQRDRDKQKQNAQKGYFIGILTQNEAREDYGREPISNGDLTIDGIKGAEMSVDKSMQRPRNKKLALAKDFISDAFNKNFTMNINKARLMHIVEKANKRERDKLNGNADKIQKNHIDDVTAFYDSVIAQAEKYIKDQGDDLNDKTADKIIKQLSEFLAGSTLLLSPTVKKIVQEGTTFGYKHIALKVKSDRRLNVGSKKVADFITERMTAIQNSVGDTMAEAVKVAIQKSIQRNLSAVETANELAKTFPKAMHVKRLALTEVQKSMNFGMFTSIKQNGVKYKQWIHTPQKNPRPEHVKMDGEIRPVGKRFSNLLMYPMEEPQPNCKCWVTAIDLDHVGFTVDEANQIIQEAA